jgi:hypothetical protein
VPFVAQGGTVLVTLFDILAGERDVIDGFLPLIISGIFFAMLVYVWFASRQVEYPATPATVSSSTEPSPPVVSEPSPAVSTAPEPEPVHHEDLRD